MCHNTQKGCFISVNYVFTAFFFALSFCSVVHSLVLSLNMCIVVQVFKLDKVLSICTDNIFYNFIGYLGTSSTDTVEIKIACKYSCFLMTCLTYSKIC